MYTSWENGESQKKGHREGAYHSVHAQQVLGKLEVMKLWVLMVISGKAVSHPGLSVTAAHLHLQR